ncbi:MAG: hypothetical protein ACTHK8_02235 [Ginsengibacter sp.]
MKKTETKNKKNSSAANAVFFVATAVIVAAAVYVTIQEGRRVKEENKLLAYDVW